MFIKDTHLPQFHKIEFILNVFLERRIPQFLYQALIKKKEFILKESLKKYLPQFLYHSHIKNKS